MKWMMACADLIDRLNRWVGHSAVWLILLMTLTSAGNAVVRKAFDFSSNALLEIQWYLFSSVFLLCAGYALQKNAHVRIDVFTQRLSARANAWIDLFGTLFFLLPVVCLVIYLSWGVFVEAWQNGERSNSAGGLIVWPARILVPIGFVLLGLQGIAELMKRIAYLNGMLVLEHGNEKTDEERLAEDLRRSRGVEESRP